MVNVFRKIMLLTAFLIAAFIFVAGFYSGILLDSYRVSDTKVMIDDTSLDAESFVVEREFFDTFSVSDCNVLNAREVLLGEQLGEIGRALARYDSKKVSNFGEYHNLKRKYFLLEIKSYTLRKTTNEFCPDIKSNVVLFFYNTENNQESLNQGYALDTLVKEDGNITVLSIDKDFNDSALLSIVAYYNITIAPTIIINFDKKFDRYTPAWEMRENLNN